MREKSSGYTVTTVSLEGGGGGGGVLLAPSLLLSDLQLIFDEFLSQASEYSHLK